MPLFGYSCIGHLVPGGRLSRAELQARPPAPNLLGSTSKLPDLDRRLRLQCTTETTRWPRERLRFQSPERDPYDQQPGLRVFEMPDGFALSCHRIVDFQLHPGPSLDFRLHRDEWGYLAEICLLGTMMAFLLESEGRPALHASAVVPPPCSREFEGAVGFLAAQGSGKSVLALSWALQGARLLSDDILALDSSHYVLPSYPRARLWPEAIEALDLIAASRSGTVEDRFDTHAQLLRPDSTKLLVDVGAGGLDLFDPTPAPLRRLYLPQRIDDPTSAISLEPLTVSEALFEVLRCSFLPPDLLAQVGFQARRLEVLSNLLRSVQVTRLRYPTGYAHLPRVHAAILADLAQDPPS